MKLSTNARRVVQGLLATLLAAFLYIVVDTVRDPHIVEAGDTAPNFKVTTLDGRTVSTGDFGGKVLVLNFWGTWCQPCRQEMPSLDEMAKTLSSQGVVVVALSVDKNEEVYKQFVQRAKPAFKTAWDPAGDISAKYGTYQYPETYIIDREGKVREKMIGAEDWMSPAVLQRIKTYL